VTLQPYRFAKPHDPAACRLCGPGSPGHHVCQHPGCDQIAASQVVQRHATADEYNTIPAGLRPIDGIATQAVFACDTHGEDIDPFCQHPAPDPVPCPTCAAAGDQPCVTAGGKTRDNHHQARADAQPPPPATCRHHHRPDCAIFDGCVCTQDDPMPDRPARVVPPPPPPGPAPVLLPLYGELRQLLEHHGVDVDRIVRTELVPKGDGSSTVQLTTTMVVRQPNGDLSYDEHGHPRTEVNVIELQIPRPTDPVTPELLARPRYGLPSGNDRNAATPLS
jgi:hypothetical protein